MSIERDLMAMTGQTIEQHLAQMQVHGAVAGIVGTAHPLCPRAVMMDFEKVRAAMSAAHGVKR